MVSMLCLIAVVVSAVGYNALLVRLFDIRSFGIFLMSFVLSLLTFFLIARLHQEETKVKDRKN